MLGYDSPRKPIQIANGEIQNTWDHRGHSATHHFHMVVVCHHARKGTLTIKSGSGNVSLFTNIVIKK